MMLSEKYQQTQDVKPLFTPRVLVVEDNEVIQYMAQTTLEILNCDVKVANNAKEAIKLYDESFDCVFLDLGLPDGNGFDVCRKMRSKFPDKKTAVIACTAHGRELEDKCKQAGMNDFTEKPLTIGLLADLLKRWIPNYELAEDF